MPLLARMLASPSTSRSGRGRRGRPAALHDRYISTTGSVLVAVGPSTGDEIWRLEPGSPARPSAPSTRPTSPQPPRIQVALGSGGTTPWSRSAAARPSTSPKYAATRAGIPMIAVATNLAHDGICLGRVPRARPRQRLLRRRDAALGGRRPRLRPPRPHRWCPAGSATWSATLSAIEDWLLAGAQRGEPVDGLALAFARTAAEAVIGRTDSVQDEAFLVVLAEALVLSGMAMAAAGTSRPCSGACHEILHAVDQPLPGDGRPRELAGLGAAFATYLRGQEDRLRRSSPA